MFRLTPESKYLLVDYFIRNGRARTNGRRTRLLILRPLGGATKKVLGTYAINRRITITTISAWPTTTTNSIRSAQTKRTRSKQRSARLVTVTKSSSFSSSELDTSTSDVHLATVAKSSRSAHTNERRTRTRSKARLLTATNSSSYSSAEPDSLNQLWWWRWDRWWLWWSDDGDDDGTNDGDGDGTIDGTWLGEADFFRFFPFFVPFSFVPFSAFVALFFGFRCLVLCKEKKCHTESLMRLHHISLIRFHYGC